MTEDEKRIINVEKRVDNLETKFEMFMKAQDERFNNFMQEMRDFKTEMRQQNQMRAEEIRELRQDMKTMQANLDAKIDGMGKHVQNLTVAAIVGIGAAVAGIGAIAVTVIYSILTR